MQGVTTMLPALQTHTVSEGMRSMLARPDCLIQWHK
jgi:hypothetical protein